MTRARRLLLGLVLLGSALLALVALGLFPQGPVRRLAEARLRSALGPGARIGALSVAPGRLRAEALDLVLEGPAYRLEIPRLRIDLAPRTLWGPVLDVRHLEIDGARILLRAAGGPGPPAEPFARPVVVRHVQMTNATLVYHDPALAGDIVLREVTLRGGLGEGALELKSPGGVWQRSPAVPLGPLSVHVAVSPLLVADLRSLEAGLVRSRLRASGRLGSLWSPELDLRLGGEVALDELEGPARIAPSRGTLRLEGTLRGPRAALRADVRLATDGALVMGWPVEEGSGQVTYDGAASGEAATRVDLALLGGRAQAEMRLAGDAVRGRLRAGGIDLTDLRRQGVLAGSGLTGRVTAEATFEGTLPGGEKDGTLRLEASLRGAGALEDVPARVEAKATGPVRVSSVSGPSLDLAWTTAVEADPAGAARDLRLTARGTARGRLPPALEGTLEGTLTATAAAAPIPVHLAGTFRAAGPSTHVRLEATGLGEPVAVSADLRGSAARVLEVSGQGIDLGLLAPQTRGRARIALNLSGPLEALSGTGTVQVTDLATRGIDVGTVTAHVQAHRGVADVALASPALAVTAQLQARPGPQAAVAGTVRLAGTPLAPFAPLLPEGRAVDGRISAEVQLRVPLAQPGRASALVQVESVEARRGDLAASSRGPFTLELRDQLLSVRGLSLQGAGVTLDAAGTVGADPGSPLALRVRAEVDLARVPVPDGWSPSGTARVDLSLSGERRRPRATGTVQLQGVTVAAATAPAVSLEDAGMELDGEALLIPGLTARLANGAATVSGRIPLAAAWPEARRRPEHTAADEGARLRVGWDGVDAAALARQLGSHGPTSVEGTLAGEAEISGGLASLEEIRVAVRLPATAVKVQELPLELAPAIVQVEHGRVSTEGLVLQMAGGSFRIQGGASLTGARGMDLTGAGRLELRALSPFLEEAALTGVAQADLRVRGTLDEPRPEGTLEVQDGTLRLRTLPQALTGIDGRVVFDRTTVRIERAQASLGGGAVTLDGGARLAGTTVEDARITVTGRDIALSYPVGMRTRLNADLTLTGRTGAFLLAGAVEATRGLYDLDVALQESLTARIPEATDSPLLRSIALDVRVDTRNPVLVRNNLAQLQAGGQLVVRGDMQTPAPLGTLEITQGGKVFLQGREFVIRSGRLVYRGTWDPDLAITAQGARPITDENPLSKGPVEVSLSLAGTLEKPALALSSTTSYSERELANLIASGNSADAGSLQALGGQAAALLAGRVSRTLRGLGFDEVSIRPELVAREGEVETGARFTFGKHLSSRVNLVYSASLQDAEGRFTQVEGTPGREVSLTVQRTDAGTFTYGAGQQLRRGGPARPRPPGDERVRLTDLRLEGDGPREGDAVRALGIRAGDRRTIWDIQEAADRMRQDLVEDGYLEAEVGARLDGTVAVFHIRTGARYAWRVEGMPDPPDLSREVRRALFEEDALERGRARVLAELHHRGYLRAVVGARATQDARVRTVSFDVTPGPRLPRVEVRFPGAFAVDASRLRETAGGAGHLLVSPDDAVRRIEQEYRRRHFLRATVGRPAVRESGGATVITVPVDEGPRALVGRVRFPGATLPEDELRTAAGLQPGAPFDPLAVAAAVDGLRAHYFERGFGGVRVGPSLEPRGDAVDVVFSVSEGRRLTVGRVEVRGLTRTRESLVRRLVRLRPGRPVDPRQLGAIERRLLDLGVFARATVTASEEDPSTITVSVEEGDRFLAAYAVRYNDDTGTRADLDGEVRNLLGRALTLGGRYGLGRDVRDARGVLSLPSLRRLGRLTASAFRLEEDLPAVLEDEADVPQNVRLQEGGQVQLSRRLRSRLEVLAGYRFKRTRLLPLFPDPIDIAAFDLSIVRDTRDSTLDARRGAFWSLSLEYSPAFLGSDFRFVKGFGQLFVTRPLGASWTWAQGARLGLAHGFEGQSVRSTERFRAGGANTLRGFATDTLGPRDALGFPLRGEAVVVLNEELRYHHPSGLGAAVFYDTGNVFDTVRDLGFDWRHAVGAGLRWASPLGLLRVDLGLPLAPRPGERRYQYFVSLGQAF